MWNWVLRGLNGLEENKSLIYYCLINNNNNNNSIKDTLFLGLIFRKLFKIQFQLV